MMNDDDDQLGAFARRHGLSADAAHELATMASALGWSTTRPPDARDVEPSAPSEAPDVDLGNPRYAIVELLGHGGQGAVYRAMDNRLGRTLAVKVLRRLASVDARRRFRAEIAITASLQHPGIVPIHDSGLTPDGRPWYAMQVLDGQHFGRVVVDADRPLRARLDVFTRACEAVAHAHQRGVVHRDLKPQNIMIGAFGEVRVLDWGVARALAVEGGDTVEVAVEHDGPGTQVGAIIGTPAYMAPEQLDGDGAAIGPATDVYALGLILAELLTGERNVGGAVLALRAARAVDRPAPGAGPDHLRDLCARMTRRDPAARLTDAGAVAAELRTWLDGQKQRAEAEALVAEAAALEPKIAALRAEADDLERQAAELLDALPPHAAIDAKRPGWVLADGAADKRREARLARIAARQALQSALRLDPESAAAAAALTADYRAGLLDAEARHDADAATEYQALLEGHDRAGNIEWLKGDGRLTLLTEPPGASVEVLRYVERDRRLVAEPLPGLVLGSTPVVSQPLPMGSYLLILRAPGRMDVRYPVFIERGGHWDGVPPGESEAQPVWLPPVGAVGEGECYVPAGWFISGGDSHGMDGLARARLWVDGFVMDRDPVTHGDYIAWLDHVVATGRREEALTHVPQQIRRGAPPELNYRLDESGRFRLTAAFGGQPALDWPVCRVSWQSALDFAAWRSDLEGGRLGLPASWQWEKGARGVDGRAFCWGDGFEPNWAQVLSHKPGPPTFGPVDGCPVDESPYGVRGTVGNVRDLCGNVYRRLGPPIRDGRPVSDREPTPGDTLVVRGGYYAGTANPCRIASRFGMPISARLMVVGFRLCRPLDGPIRSSRS